MAATEEDTEPLSFEAEVLALCESLSSKINLAKVNVKGTDRFCKVPVNIFSVGEKVVYVRPDVDVIFSEASSPESLGVIYNNTGKPYKSTSGRMGEFLFNGSILKPPSDEDPWVQLEKHVSSTPLAGGNFPTHLIKKTNEKNAENNPDILDQMINKPVDVTVKLDGQSVTLIYQPNNPLMVCSRNLILTKDDPITKWFVERFPHKLDIFSADSPEDQKVFAIQGEYIGPKINCNMLRVTENQYFIFHVEESKKRLNREEMEKRLVEVLTSFPQKDVNLVPLLMVGSFSDLQELEAYGEKQFYSPGVLAEGIVVKDHHNYKLSLKLVNKCYKSYTEKQQQREKGGKKEKKKKEKKVEV